MYVIKYFCRHSGGVFSETFGTLLEAQQEWDRLEFKRSTHMHTPRPC